jgi:hypothetical protein
MFFANRVFLKTPRRLEALSLIMGLCLLFVSLCLRATSSPISVSSSRSHTA